MADEARLTRLGIEALAGATDTVRCTRVGIEALAGANDTVRCTRVGIEVLVAEPIAKTASNSLTLGQVAHSHLQRLSASNTLGLSQTVHVTPIMASASNTLSFSNVANSNIKYRTASNTLNLTHDVNDYYFVSAANSLTQPVFDDQGFLINVLGLEQVATARIPILNRSASNQLSFSHSARTTKTASASNTLTLSQEAENSQGPVNTLNLTQTVVSSTSKAASNDLDLTQVVIVTGDFNRPVSNTLSLVHSAIARIGNPEKDYAPSGVLPAAPTLAYTPFQLTYPYVSPTQTVELRSPEFGNRQTLSSVRINRLTRGGDLIVYRDSNWPQTETLELEFVDICETDIGAVRTFLDSSVGQEIGLRDWEGRQWRGIILTPDAQITESSLGFYTFQLQFEGELA